MKIRTVWIIGLTLFFNLSVNAEDSIAINNEGNYVINYIGTDQNGDYINREVVYEPTNKVSVTVEEKTSSNYKGSVKYIYNITNDPNSIQNIANIKLGNILINCPFVANTNRNLLEQGWAFKPENLLSDAEMSEIVECGNSMTISPNWTAIVMPSYNNNKLDLTLSYLKDTERDGLPPGSSMKTEFESPDLPGLGFISVEGSTGTIRLSDMGPINEQMHDQLNELLLRRDLKETTTLAVIPQIMIPNPFDVIKFLNNLNGYIQDTIIAEHLVDEVKAKEIILRIHESIDNIRNNIGANVAHKELQNLRSFIHNISPLVSKHNNKNVFIQTMDFNLRYIEKLI